MPSLRPLALTATLALAATTATGVAQQSNGRQDRPSTTSSLPRFRVGLGLAGGRFEFDESGATPREDRTEAGFARIELEGVSRRGFGGGFRFEGIRSDDDLFDTGGSRVEATSRQFYGHFSWLARERNFAMRIRFGLLFDRLELDQEMPGFVFSETEYTTFAPYFELEPEFIVFERGPLSISAFAEFGIGGGITFIDQSNDGREWDSTTGLIGFETGARVRFSKLELQASYVGRWRAMDRSDPEGGAVFADYDSEFHGLFLGFGIAL